MLNDVKNLGAPHQLGASLLPAFRFASLHGVLTSCIGSILNPRSTWPLASRAPLPPTDALLRTWCSLLFPRVYALPPSPSLPSPPATRSTAPDVCLPDVTYARHPYPDPPLIDRLPSSTRRSSLRSSIVPSTPFLRVPLSLLDLLHPYALP